MQVNPLTSGQLRELREAIGAIPGVRLVVVFGSVARGKAFPGSDVDVGVMGGGFWDQLELGSQIGALLRREAHVADLGTAGEMLRYLVARDGIPIFEIDPTAWPRFQAEAAIAYFDFEPTLRLCAEAARHRVRAEAGLG
jgi:predicted nucleotidyltransferase